MDTRNQVEFDGKEDDWIQPKGDTLEDSQTDPETIQISQIPRVAWGLEGRSMVNISLTSAPDPNGDTKQPDPVMKRQDLIGTQISKEADIQSITSTPTLISEPTLRDVLMAVQACNNSLLSLTNQMVELKGDIAVMRQENQKIS